MGSTMNGVCKANGRLYRWALVCKTNAFPALTCALTLPQIIDVLRICGDEPGFDVVIRIDGSGQQECRYLGPMLCIDHSVLLEMKPHWPNGALLRLRPRLIRLPEEVDFRVVVERVIQWCTSPGFRAVRVKPTGSVWVDNFHADQ